MTLHDGKLVACSILTHQVAFPRGFYVGGRNHPHHVVGYCYRGLSCYGMGDPPQYGRVGAGELYLVPPGMDYHFWSPEGEHEFHVIYSLFIPTPRLTEQMPFEPNHADRPGFVTMPLHDAGIRRRIQRRFRAMLRLSRSDLPLREALQYNGVEEILLWAQLDQSPSVRRLDPRVRQALTLIRTHLATPLSVDELAQHCNTSRSRLSALFTEQIGLPPMSYWEQCRLGRAMDLLKVTTLTVDQIAQDLGYSSASHFSHRFKQEVGLSPAAFRKSHDQISQ